MGNKKNKNLKGNPARPATQKAAVIETPDAGRKNTLLLLIPVVATAVVYFISLRNGWIKNWDDGGYIFEHKLIQKLSWENIQGIFTVFYKGNYHPLTTLFYAVEYSLVVTKPFLYHFNNLVLHLLNVALVFTLVKLVIKRPEIAFISALIFGIHPMHVESVAWVSERKDVLYTFLFMISLLCYYYYFIGRENRRRYYIIAVVSFVLSLLAKSAAVCLPLVMVLMDLYLVKSWKGKYVNHSNSLVSFFAQSIQSLKNKIPFLVLALIFGIIAVKSQGAANAVQDLAPLYSSFERVMIVSYSSVMYIVKFFVPVNLACMYPYPDRIGGHLPTIYFVMPFILLAFFVLVYISRRYTKMVLFGTLFYFATIVLVLQILAVGGAIMAERYTYVPYIGLSIITGWCYTAIKDSKAKIKSLLYPFTTILAAGMIMFSYLTFERIKLWKDGEVLFTDLIKTYPNLPFAYNNRGYLYFNFIKDYDKAMKDYTKSLQIDPTFHQAYSNRGVLYYNIAAKYKNKDSIYQLSLSDFNNAIKYKSNSTDAIIGRGKTYATLGKYDKALADYNLYLAYKNNVRGEFEWDVYRCKAIAEYSLGIACAGRKSNDSASNYFNDAFNDINVSIGKFPNSADNYFQRGYIYFQQKKFKEAITDFDQSDRLQPKQFQVYFWRGFAKYSLKRLEESIADYTLALQVNDKDPATFINRSTDYYELKDYASAFKDYCSAGDLGQPLNKEYFFKLKALAGK